MYMQMCSKRFILILLLILAQKFKSHEISKRYVLFPQYTVLQFTYGFSVPLVLPSRTINLSLCLQSNYDLPFNITNFEIKDSRAQKGTLINMKRLDFYEYAIQILEELSFNGEDCLLRSICEIAEIPMHLEDNESLLENLVHYLFTPSLDLLEDNKNNSLVQKLLVAEDLGKKKISCEEAFADCDISLVDIFTDKYIF